MLGYAVVSERTLDDMVTASRDLRAACAHYREASDRLVAAQQQVIAVQKEYIAYLEQQLCEGKGSADDQSYQARGE